MKMIVLLLVSLLSACTSEYSDHIRRTHTSITSSSGGVSSGVMISDFHALPDLDVLRKITDDIDTAKDRIWIEIYTWTEKSTLEAVIRAKKRGVDVRVILEGSVYRTPWINNNSVEQLKNADIDVVYSDNRRYNFTHIKSWIIDDIWCISTGNWSYTTFTKNREFIVCSEDASIRANLEEIFVSDFRHVRPYFPSGLDSRIGLSPENIRPWLYESLSHAKNKIIVYNQSLSDEETLDILGQKADEGVIVETCQAYRAEELADTPAKKLPSLKIASLTSKKPYLHAKVFLLDDDRVILGSANLTTNALDNNREILINLGKNPKIYETIFSLYHKDCDSSGVKE